MHAHTFVNSTLCNLLKCAVVSNVPVDSIVDSEHAVRKALRLGPAIPEGDLAAAHALLDVCLFREGLTDPGFSLCPDEIECALIFFTM